METMRDHGAYVQTGLQHYRHLVPGLVNLTAVDALDGQHVKDYRAPVDREITLGDAQAGDLGAVAHIADHIAQRRAGLPDISSPTSKPSVMPSCFCTSARVPSRAFNATVTPIFFAS